jgi:hypothetical protein
MTLSFVERAGMTSARKENPMPQQAARIDPTGKVVASDRNVRVRKGQNEDVLWIALGNGGPWRITFDKGTNSPFSQTEYFLARGEFVQTVGGPVNGAVSGNYKYNVREDRSRIITDDPDVDIDP